jgi:WD40 repeat protein
MFAKLALATCWLGVAPPIAPELPPGAVVRFGDPAALSGLTDGLLLSPDGRILIRHGRHGHQVYDLRTGRPAKLALPAGCGVECVRAFAPNGDAVVVGEGTVRLVTRSGQVRLTQPLEAEQSPSTVMVSANGRMLVCAWSLRSAVHAYDLTQNGKAQAVQLGNLVSNLVALSNDGKRLATFVSKTTLEVWDTRTGKKLNSLEIPEVEGFQYVRAGAFSPDGRMLAAEFQIGGLRLWQVGPAALAGAAHRPGRKLLHLRYAPDGQTLTGLTKAGEVIHWDTRTGKRTGGTNLARVQVAEDDRVAFAVSADGNTLVLEHEGQPLLAWDLAARKQLLNVPFNPPLERLTSHEKARIRMVRGRSVVEWDARTGAVTRQWPRPNEPWRLESLCQPGRKVHARYDSEAKRVVVHALPSGKELYRAGPVEAQSFWEPLLATRDRQFLAVGNAGSLRLFRAGRSEPILQQQGRTVAALGFSPDGRFLLHVPRSELASNENGRVLYPFRELVLTELTSRKVRSRVTLRLSDNQEEIRDLLFDPAGRFVVAACESDTFVIDLAGARIRCRLDGSRRACLSPDGRWLALGNRLHDLGTASVPRSVTLDLREDEVRGLTFTSDGKFLVTACDNGTALVWDMAFLAGRARPPADPTIEQLWTQLAEADAEKAGKALRRLTAAPDGVVRLIRDRIHPVRNVAEETITRLVADLDSPRFATRDAAERRLARLGELAENALRAVVREGIDLERRRRAERLLGRLDNLESTPERLRMLRAVEALEIIGTPGARRVLMHLAGGAARARLSVEAKAALDRLRLADEREGMR